MGYQYSGRAEVLTIQVDREKGTNLASGGNNYHISYWSQEQMMMYLLSGGGGSGLCVFDHLFHNQSTLWIFFFTRGTTSLWLPTASGWHLWSDSWSGCHRKGNAQCSRTKGTMSRSQTQREPRPPWQVSHLHTLQRQQQQGLHCWMNQVCEISNFPICIRATWNMN